MLSTQDKITTLQAHIPYGNNHLDNINSKLPIVSIP